MTGKLSARLRPHAEAAPWVIEAVVRLEQEVERLRAEVERLRAEVERERAAVVAFLRDGLGGEQGRVEYADDIERGEHRRKEEE